MVRDGWRSKQDAYVVLSGSGPEMMSILFAMLAIVLLAGVVVLYVAFPHRGEDVPRVPWVGDAMRRGVNQLPTLDNQRARQDH